ncbi:MAG: response regulator transcription factor, partial [Lachnospiraceae bacterium]|nr:response regulator transcription factor [Lachnospiraceae bacterium]
RAELAELLCNAGYETVELVTFENALEKILNAYADLVLMDINIPYLNGELVLKELRKESDVPVIMVTSKNTEVDEVLSMSYGADDYITKPYNPTLLLLRINNIFKRMSNTSDIWDYEALKLNTRKGTVQKGELEVVLTKNEMLILSFLVSRRGQIVTRDELMTDLWNNDEYINDNALTVNISRLRAKLKSLGYGEAIDTRKGQGYILL